MEIKELIGKGESQNLEFKENHAYRRVGKTNQTVQRSPGEIRIIERWKTNKRCYFVIWQNPQRFFIQSETRCARFKGIKPLEFIDMKVFGGDIIDQRAASCV